MKKKQRIIKQLPLEELFVSLEKCIKEKNPDKAQQMEIKIMEGYFGQSIEEIEKLLGEPKHRRILASIGRARAKKRREDEQKGKALILAMPEGERNAYANEILKRIESGEQADILESVLGNLVAAKIQTQLIRLFPNKSERLQWLATPNPLTGRKPPFLWMKSCPERLLITLQKLDAATTTGNAEDAQTSGYHNRSLQ